MSVGLAPTSIDLAQRALASGLDPMTRCTWFVESTEVRSEGGIDSVILLSLPLELSTP